MPDTEGCWCQNKETTDNFNSKGVKASFYDTRITQTPFSKQNPFRSELTLHTENEKQELAINIKIEEINVLNDHTETKTLSNNHIKRNHNRLLKDKNGLNELLFSIISDFIVKNGQPISLTKNKEQKINSYKITIDNIYYDAAQNNQIIVTLNSHINNEYAALDVFFNIALTPCGSTEPIQKFSGHCGTFGLKTTNKSIQNQIKDNFKNNNLEIFFNNIAQCYEKVIPRSSSVKIDFGTKTNA